MAKAKNSGGAVAAEEKVGGSGLRNVVFMSMFLTAVIPVGVSSYVNYESAKASLNAATEATLKVESKANADLLESWVGGNMTAIQAMAMASDAQGDKEQASAYVKRLQKKAPWFYAFFTIDKEGMQTAKSDDKLNNVADRAYFKSAIKGTEFYQISISKTTNKPAFLPAAPIKNEQGEIVGVFGGGADMDAISSKITGRKVGMTGFSYLVADDGTILAHPKADLIGKQADSSVANLTRDNTMDESAASGVAVKRVYNTVGNGYKLITQIDKEEVEAPLEDILRSTLTYLGLATALALVASFMLGSAIAKSINRLSALAMDLSVAQSPDEIAKLESEIKKVKGSKEVRGLGVSLGRLANSIRLALEAMM